MNNKSNTMLTILYNIEILLLKPEILENKIILKSMLDYLKKLLQTYTPTKPLRNIDVYNFEPYLKKYNIYYIFQTFTDKYVIIQPRNKYISRYY